MRQFTRLIALVIVMVITAAGCAESGDGLDRQPISGSITLNGLPLASGLITFVPSGAPEPVATAAIEDGSYALDREDGPVSGPHRVTIWASAPTGQTIHDPYYPDEPIEETREIIPNRYNTQSVLTADVKTNDENGVSFQLEGSPPDPSAEPSASTRGRRSARR